MAESNPAHTSSETDRQTKMRDLQWDNFYDPSTAVLHANWDEGFFSNCTTALWALTDLAAEGITPASLCMDRGWDKYCDRRIHGALDLHKVFFKTQPDVATNAGGPLPRLHHHGRYARLGLERWSPFIARWFTPSDEVAELQRTMAAKHGFVSEETIGCFYRGTDKDTEIVVSSAGEYIRMARALASRYPTHRIFLQTDQSQMQERFLDAFGSRCFFVEEMPVTRGKTGLHFLAEAELGMDRVRFGMLGLAVTRLLSECRILVNSTGNMALWATLYRGNTVGMYQVDEHGDLADPEGHDFMKNPFRVMTRRLKRFLSPLRLGRLRSLYTASRR